MTYRLFIAVLLGSSLALPIVARAQEDPTPIACQATADCPLALECETTRIVESCPAASPDDGPASDAGCTIEEEPVEAPSCVYAPEKCTDDTECEPGLVCQAIGSEGECTSSGSAEPTCVEREVSFCFPMRDDCTESSECDEGWRCTMLPQDALDDPPSGWEGATKICVPEGIALVLEGQIKLARRAAETSGDRNSGLNEGMGSEMSATDGDAPSGSAGGCSVPAVKPMQSAGRHALILLALSLLVRRRRTT